MINWGQVCRPKWEGGLGVLNLDSLNSVLLAKWWRIVVDHDSMVDKLIKDKYGTRVNHWWGKSRNISNVSAFWKGVVSVNECFWLGLQFNIG